jgi:hypothetical protein
VRFYYIGSNELTDETRKSRVNPILFSKFNSASGFAYPLKYYDVSDSREYNDEKLLD